MGGLKGLAGKRCSELVLIPSPLPGGGGGERADQLAASIPQPSKGASCVPTSWRSSRTSRMRRLLQR
eukprot:7400030-Pyramimonas_sp.AAC.1